ncbi:MAG: transposase [Atopobiaceae bacterium]|nr:transposase [Atopobiaceae bacterium]
MRTARKQSEADIYHVVARGTGQQIIFEDDADRRRFLEFLKGETKVGELELYAWCLMSNHVHLLVHATLEALALGMRHLLSSYAAYFNRKTGRVGHLFQDRFRSEPVNDDAYLLTLVRYIHQNPVKAGLAKVDEYRWSSYREYLEGTGICDVRFPLSVFGSIGEFERMHGVPVQAAGCLDAPDGRPARMLPDDEALDYARGVLGGVELDGLKALPVDERNAHLAKLKRAGFSVRQIARLTGIGRYPIQQAR